MAKRRMVPHPPTRQSERGAFFDLAAQYYVSGRFAFICGFIPVGANLLHHAVEMYLKGTLTHWLTLDELRKLRHNIKKAWRRFRSVSADPSLARFDNAVADLHRFERLRYPDAVLSEGLRVQYALLKGQLVKPVNAPKRREPSYELVLENVDELIVVILKKAGATPAGAFPVLLRSEAKQFLKLHNQRMFPGVV